MAGLYLHVPFCTQRCVYCDFYFTTTRSDHDSFVDALCTEIALCRQTYGEPLETVYLGGGTPSLLASDNVERILRAVRAHFDVSGVTETTLELNPEDAGVDKLRDLRHLGINRLSIGVQSFVDDDLRFMNRSHSAEDAKRIVPRARKAGFEDLSVDLIFGLPDQPAEHWQANLERAARMRVPHISAYGLTIEPETPLSKQIELGRVEPASDDTMRDRYQQTMSVLREAGYEHYEVSSFAQPGRRARHNSRYWQHANYLGLGPSAHSFWWDEDGPRRWSNPPSLHRYEKNLARNELPREEADRLSRLELAREYVMLRLRTAGGLDLERLRDRYGYGLRDERSRALDRLTDAGYVHQGNEHLRLTDAGRHVCDAVIEALLPGQ
ncbi:MAG: coproporphyrinogen III oxidase [Bacteroidetes bacterium QS_8_64_10]|nr:MAG: coproporphyrinogen III oxidase [Bacteroidetes bacterium QS_8_64_10]